MFNNLNCLAENSAALRRAGSALDRRALRCGGGDALAGGDRLASGGGARLELADGTLRLVVQCVHERTRRATDERRGTHCVAVLHCRGAGLRAAIPVQPELLEERRGLNRSYALLVETSSRISRKLIKINNND